MTFSLRDENEQGNPDGDASKSECTETDFVADWLGLGENHLSSPCLNN